LALFFLNEGMLKMSRMSWTMILYLMWHKICDAVLVLFSFIVISFMLCTHFVRACNIFTNISNRDYTGLSIFFKSASTSLFSGSTYDKNLKNFYEYFIQHYLRSGGTKDHFRWVKVPGTASYWKAWSLCCILEKN